MPDSTSHLISFKFIALSGFIFITKVPWSLTWNIAQTVSKHSKELYEVAARYFDNLRGGWWDFLQLRTGFNKLSNLF
jgi:hypothetical protein